MKGHTITKNEFIMRMILIFFSQYRNRQEEIITHMPVDRFYSWDEMMDFTDPQKNKSFEAWRAYLQLWEAPEAYLDFFAKFIVDYEMPSPKNNCSKLRVEDAERIFNLACVMSYALEKRSPFYEGLKTELQDTVFGLAEL